MPLSPTEERVKIEEPWDKAIAKAINKPKPKDGWPRQEDNKRSRRR